METGHEEKVWYVCNPLRNTGCRKSGCAYNPKAKYGRCVRTSNPAFAVLDESGAPVKADAKAGEKLPAFRDTKRRG